MKNVIVAVFAAMVTAVLVVACGGSKDVCKDKNIRCEDPLTCDPADGVCKCGGAGGVECKQGEVCDAPSNTCLSTRCAGVNCSAGTSCDQLDGTCKCGGTGGTVCGEGEICNPAAKACVASTDCNQVACPVNQTCDATSAQCKCGDAVCGVGETCTVNADNTKACVPDNCSGVKCLGDTTCDPADGQCKCNGAVCPGGSVCGCPGGADGGTCDAATKACVPSTACANVTCQNGTTCDPIDGQCKCGGPGGPVCTSEQICSLTTFQCQGGDQCTLPGGGAKMCPMGTSCDPEDGLCKCGGRGGEVCDDGSDGGVEETCVQSHFSQACRPKCDVLLQNCTTAGQYCFFDLSAKNPSAYCAVPTGNQEVGKACVAATDCFTMTPSPRGLFCAGLGSFDDPGTSGLCRQYCQTGVTGACPFSNGDALYCDPITGQGWSAPPGVGYCTPH